MLNRTVSRAESTAAVLAQDFPHARIEAGHLSPEVFARVAPGARLVIVCTAGDAAPRIARLDPGLLPSDATWVDINYWMADPPHQDSCRERDMRFLTGHGMLGHQAALAFELFTGHPVQPADVLAILSPGAGPGASEG
jgi:shikimate 5-dehydrogenase